LLPERRRLNAICDDLGVQCEFIVVPFDGIVSGLKNNKYDAIISAFTITPEREKVVDFSQPYYQAGQSIAVRLDEQRIKSIDDLVGKKVGVQLGTTGEILAKKIEGAEIISIIAVKGKAKIVGETLTSENYGIAVRKGEQRLLDAINESLQKLLATGKLQRINEKWFSSPSKTESH